MYLDVTVEDVLAGEDVDASVVMVGPSLKFAVSLTDNANAYVMGSGGYVKAEVSLGGGDSDADGYFWQVGGGLQFFVTDSVALNDGLSYQQVSLSEDEADADVDLDGLTVSLGLSVFMM